MFLFWLIIFLTGLYILYTKREKEEELLFLKLVGYYFLGSFYLNLNGLVLPLGFVVSLFFKPTSNKGIKRGAAIFGLIMMLIGFIYR